MKMPHWKPAPLLLAIAVLVLPATGQSVPPGDRTLENAFGTSGFHFLYDPGPMSQAQQANFNLQTIDGFGPGYVYDFCADFFTGNNANSTFDVSDGFGDVSSKESQIRALFTNALPVFNDLLDQYIADNGGDWAENTEIPALVEQFDELQAYGAGMQIALWEIIHEQTADLSIDDEGTFPDPGSFRVDVSASSGNRADLGDNFAEEFLTNVRTGTWTNQGGVNFYYAEGGTDQDRLWMVVPEPSSALLGGIGLLALLRRRRA